MLLLHSMGKTWLIIAGLFWATCGMAQGGFNVQIGTGSLIVNNESFTKSGEAHYGLRLGGFARIGDDGWFIRPGLFYERYHAESSSSFNALDKGDHLHFLKGYVNLGLYIIRSDLFKLRLNGGGTIDYLAAIDNRGDVYKLADFSDAAIGINGGLGIDIAFITIDLGYEKGLTKFLTDDDSSRSEYYNLSLGFFF